MGGNPFGHAGTDNTESVKSLVAQFGRFVFVFCCDENFDFNVKLHTTLINFLPSLKELKKIYNKVVVNPS